MDIKTPPGSAGALEIPAQTEMTRSESESAAIAQHPNMEQGSEKTRNILIAGDDSAPKTPDSHRLKRKGSDLTPQLTGGPSPSSISKTPTSGLNRMNLGVPPTFNLNNLAEQLSSSPKKPRRTRPGVPRLSSERDLPAKSAEPNIAGWNFNVFDDDPFGPFTMSDDDALIFESDRVAYGRYAKSAHSGFDPEGPSAQDWKESIHIDTRPTIRKLAPYFWRPPISLAPEMIICEAITKKLTKREMGIAKLETPYGWIPQKSHTGWMYIYQLPNETNRVKIGITQDSIERRLDSWTEQCGHKTQPVYPLTDSEREPVPNIYRLEALVQAELAASRLEETGCRCGKKKHIEWFEEALVHVRKVVVKWSEWMRTQPYKEFESGHWHLSPEYIPNLVELSCPTPRDPVEGSAINPIQI